MGSITGGTLLAYTPCVIETEEPVFPAGPDKANAYTFQMAVVAAKGGTLILVDTQTAVVEVSSQLELLILLFQGNQPAEFRTGNVAAVTGGLTLRVCTDTVEAAQAHDAKPVRRVGRVLERADERAQQSFMGSLIGNRFPFIGEGNMAFNNFLTHDSLFKIQSDVIRKLATEHSCLFVGRCADYILRDFPNCVNVFISASKEFRIKRVCDMYKVKEEEAAKLIEDADKKRAIYYNYYSYKKWGAAATYHLCIDSSVLGIDKTVEFIKDFVKAKISTPKE